jgi:hypothetical protein
MTELCAYHDSPIVLSGGSQRNNGSVEWDPDWGSDPSGGSIEVEKVAERFKRRIPGCDRSLIRHRYPEQRCGAPLVIGSRLGRQKLDGSFPIEPGVFGKIHLTHPTSAEAREDAVTRNRCVRRVRFFSCCGSVLRAERPCAAGRPGTSGSSEGYSTADPV